MALRRSPVRSRHAPPAQLQKESAGSWRASFGELHGRRVSLEKFIASVVFLAQALGIETERARRLLRFLLAKEYRLDPRTFAARRWAGPSRGSRAGTGCRLRVAASGSGRECGRAAATDAELTLAVCSYADGLRRAADGAAAMG